MNPAQLLRVLRARVRLVTTIFLVTLLSTVAISAAMPRKYTAGTSLIVDVRSTDPLLGGSPMPPASVQGYLATQVDILRSERVTGRVIAVLDLMNEPYLLKRWRAAERDRDDMKPWLTTYLLDRMAIDPAREGSTITLSFEGHDPRFTAAVADAWARAYVDAVLDLRVEPARDYAAWFEQRSNAYRRELDAAQARLSAFQQQSGIVASDERYDVESNRLQELSSQWVVLQSQAADSRSRADALRRDGRESMPEVVQNPLVQTLKAELGRAEARVEELSARLGEAHPQMQAARAETAALRERLASEIARVTGSILTGGTVNVSRERDIRNALEAQRDRVLKLKKDRDHMAVLQRDVDTARKALESVSQRVTQTHLESQTRLSNVGILSPAVVPSEPSRPKPLLNAVAGVVVGALIAVFAALTLEAIHVPVRTPGDLRHAAAVPVLAVLPHASSRRPQRLVADAGSSGPPGTLRLGE